MNKNTGTKRIKTARLVLRKFRITDYLSARKWFTDPRIATFSTTKAPPTKMQIFKSIVKRVLSYYKKDYYSWAIVYNGKMSGFVELLPIQKRENAYSFSYKLDIDLNNQGITTEAVSNIIDYLKTQNIRYVIAVCDINNKGSKRVMEKSGMTQIGDPETNPPKKYSDNTQSKTYYYRYVFNK